MHVTNHAAELCALLVNDLYGELPSRILIALLTKGPSNIGQLASYTSLGSRHIRHGLGVLVQQNLLFHHTDQDSRGTIYEANPDASYNLVRSGKILQIVETQHGNAERDLVQALMLLGHARIADLAQAFESRKPRANGHSNGTGQSSGMIESEGELNSVLSRLIRAEIIETVRPDSFRNPKDVHAEIERDVTKTRPGEKASTKNKAESMRLIAERMQQFRDQGTILKRQLDQRMGPVTKRRKLENGHDRNGHSDDFDDVPSLNPNTVVRINHEKCLVELRNQRLATFAADTLGGATGEVYRTLLSLLTAKLPRCRRDALIDDELGMEEQAVVTTLDVYDHLDESVNIFSGIGSTGEDKIDADSAEKIRASRPQDSDDESDSSDGPSRNANGIDADSDDSESEARSKPLNRRSLSRFNGDRTTKVQFEEDLVSTDDRLEKMRQHLLLLAESKHRFIRHCGTQSRGQWTVDFRQLLRRLRETELDAFIEQSFGRHGLRLTRILREKGKMDEKMLPAAALMKKPDVLRKMLAMQMAGLVDVQEVPKDNSRMANRTLFFWHFEGEHTQSQLLDNIYKIMLRCLLTLDVQRYNKRDILSFVERQDVQGKEEEVMTEQHYDKYNQHLEAQNKLLGQVMRLDDMVAVLRDY